QFVQPFPAHVYGAGRAERDECLLVHLDEHRETSKMQIGGLLSVSQEHLRDLTDLYATELDRRARIQALQGAGKEADELLSLGEETARPEDRDGGDREDDRAQDEDADQRRVGLPPAAHGAARSGRSSAPRVRKRWTFGLGGWSRSSRGFPCADMVRTSVSRKMQSSTNPKMLGSSCDTMTTVAPRLSRSDRIRSSSIFELIGSSPADGSSRKSTSGSSAMARARPARFCIPPLISEGKWSSKPRSPTSASFSSATSRISAGPRSVNSPSGSPTFSASVMALQSALPWNRMPKVRRRTSRSSGRA